jgi:hypothetical protein
VKPHIGLLLPCALVACEKTAPRPADAAPAPASASASASASSAAPRDPSDDPPWKGMTMPAAPPHRFFPVDKSLCLATPAGATACAEPADDGPRLLLAFRPRPKMTRLVEGAVRVPCFLTADDVAVCRGKEAARSVKSVAGAPYLLAKNGSVVVAHGFDPPLVVSDALRDATAKKLPPLERVVAAENATCGLDQSARVWCWPEPRMPIAMRPIATHPTLVPGVADVVDLTLMPWLALCVRTKAGAILCSSAPAQRTEVCVLRGHGPKNDLRCGVPPPDPDAPAPEGGGYDPMTALEGPLVAVPGFEGADPAVTLAAYAGLPTYVSDREERVFVPNLDEGGCARLASGAVRCWERDICAAGSPWRSAAVQDLPKSATRIRLGANDGYALTDDGVLYTWPRRSPRVRRDSHCAEPAPLVIRAERLALDEPALDVGGGTFEVEGRPSYEAHVDLDCVTLASGSVRCWHTDPATRASAKVLLAW